MNVRMLVATALVFSAVNGFAQSTIPATGLAAEGAGDWKQALDIYKGALEGNPHDASLWVRVADIEARLAHLDESATPLRRATEEAPTDPMLLQRLSQTYAMLQQPQAALEAIERALALSPDSIEFLRARATLASWIADYGRAQDSYRRLCVLRPDDHDALLSLARVNAWDGRTDAAVDAYNRYLRVEPDAAAVWIELARTEAWRGNFSAAQNNLEQYRTRFGADDAYSREVAAVLARAGRPGKALDTLAPMLRQHPDDYELNLTRTIALTMQRSAREAAGALDTLRQLQPDGHDTLAAERAARMVLASSADPGVTLYGDSSGLEAQRVAPRATVKLSTGTTFTAAFEHERLTALAGSELAQIDGTPDAQHDHTWLTAAQQIGIFNVRGRIGHERTMAGGLTAYAIGADITPVDWKVSESIGIGVSLALGAQRDDFSPSFRLGGSVTGEATFGIYNAWGLKVSGGETFNQRSGSGAFRGHGLGVSVIRRF